jgi:iron(III) transport system permease protein
MVRLGRWRWPAVGFLAAVVGLALVLPVATIGWWLIRGALGGEPLRFVVETAIGTFAVGAVSALAGVALALVVAVLVARYPSRLAGAVETSVFSGYALPGIVVALSLVFLATRTLPILYQTFALLIAAYAVRHIPQAVGGLRAALTTSGTRLEDAGRTLGDGPLRVFGRVTLPLLRPSLVAGGALIFLTVVKELPLALVLAPIGFETLATQVWDAATSGFYARAAGPAALLLVLSMTTVAILLRAEDRAR